MASLPLFFHAAAVTVNSEVQLDEDTARHVVQVLRMQPGEKIQLTDGKGSVAETIITGAGKKKCTVSVHAITRYPETPTKLHLGIAFTKNSSRNEWLLEKATELGVSSIIPVVAIRTEREKTKYDRWQNIIVSAMLQSKQYYLPILQTPANLESIFSNYDVQQKLIAHCITDIPRIPITKALKAGKETLILIGPEGDFTEDEVTLCEQHGFSGISLAAQRLRTETAAMSVCAYFNTINNETV